eukprot:403340177
MTYSEYSHLCEKYKQHGLIQFVHIYNAHKNRDITCSKLHCGEELEYSIVQFDHDAKRVYLSTEGYDLIQEFHEKYPDHPDITLHPEFGNWMVEAVPTEPYGSPCKIQELLSCLPKLTSRREILREFFDQKKIQLVSIASPFILGMKDHIIIQDQNLIEEIRANNYDLEKVNQYSHSRFTIDSTENPHPRFPGLMKSIRERRGEKVSIYVPIYRDVNTNLTVSSDDEPQPGFIYMDSMHSGMGNSCLQVTFEALSLNHSRYLNDMFLPFTPILAALSQSAPFYKGKISDIDLRWDVIAQSVDCRTADERDPDSENYIPKSRYSTINHYISDHQYVKQRYMDTYQYKVNQQHVDYLLSQGVDQRLAFHIASLFIRDPIPTFDYEHDESKFDDSQTTAHFENLQSTNWCSMRFKPPPSKDSKIGWRVELRTMDIQLTDFENAALFVLVGMIYNILNYFDINLLMDISKIDENMHRAHQVDACSQQKFWFRTNILPTGKCYKYNKLEESDYIISNDFATNSTQPNANGCCFKDEEDYHELYLHEILEGKVDEAQELNYKGIFPLINEFMVKHKYEQEQVDQIKHYMEFILERAKGNIMTGARYQRNFVLNHPDYHRDSIITPTVAYDLFNHLQQMNTSQEVRAEFLGKKWAV